MTDFLLPYNNYIAADCIKKIIMKNTIKSLIIGGNKIRDNGMKLIAEGFQHNHSLTILKIHRCLLTEEGMYDHKCDWASKTGPSWHKIHYITES